MAKTRAIPHIDTYFELVRAFPLRRIKSNAEHSAAVAQLTKVAVKHQDTKDAGAIDYLDILARLIDDYERSAGMKLDLSHVKPSDLIHHLMAENGLSISGLARQIGMGQSNLSEMLSGRRDFSKAAIGKLCERFGIESSVFFQQSNRAARKLAG